jgi:hypothetical protein
MTPENKIKSSFSFNKENLNFLLSCLIGDGCLTRTGRFVVAHGLQQQDYCEWKAKRFSDILNQEIKALPTRQCTQLQFQRKTLKTSYLRYYIDSKKRIDCILKDISNPLEAIAIWVCDDGNVNPSINKTYNKCYSASIQIFTFTDLEETVQIVRWFEKHVGLKPNMMFMDRSKNNRKSAYKIKFSAADSRKLFEMIKNYIPNIPSMQYKFRYLLEYNLPTRPQQPN